MTYLAEEIEADSIRTLEDGSMLQYRAYLLDEDDHITGVEIITAASLSKAAQLASKVLQTLPQVSALELWDGDKLLCALPPAVHVKRARKAARARRSDELARRTGARTDMTAISLRLVNAQRVSQQSNPCHN
ncbi:MAG TPA: hypothetical protein VJU82_11830 [Acidobacteriaceae bacterium]|nr:hypothetical protein [Acidobacteriaceae bacterium]